MEHVMPLIHVVPAITEEASGPSYSVVRLCQSLIESGEDLTLAALDWSPYPSMPEFMKVFPLGIGPRRLGRSPEMSRWLMGEASSGRAEVIHNHGMWQMNAVYPAWAARQGNVQLVYSPRGSLSEWAMRHGSKLKNIFWPVLQRPALRRATCFHATAESEYHDIRRLGFTQPVAVIPNGIDLPIVLPKTFGEQRTLLFLGRIHPKKGLDMLLAAWRVVQECFPRWRLIIAGSDDGFNGSSGYRDELLVLIRSLGVERAEFVGNLYGTEKMQAYRDADLFVLPTYSENFGMTVAESLAAGTPVIVSKGAPWSGMDQNDAGWWIEIGGNPLVACLKDALSRSPAELAAMGENGRAWMERDFLWDGIGAKMAATYRWLCDRSLPVPAWVRLDL
jgi:glycosyltransferase involved in cell wall biosynthesis